MKKTIAAVKQCGMGLLELLLVLVGMALITLISINRYQQYRRQTEVAEVKTDVAVIYQALNSYFHTSGCNSEGIFLGKSDPGIHEDLGFARSYEARYAVHVMDSGNTTSGDKPIYFLEVILKVNATFANATSPQRLQWYRQEFNAAEVDTSTPDEPKLTWKRLPGSGATGSNNALWILDGSRKLFRKTENEANPALNSNYCAE